MTQSNGQDLTSIPSDCETRTAGRGSVTENHGDQQPADKPTEVMSEAIYEKAYGERPSSGMESQTAVPKQIASQKATELVARTATLGSRWNWLNWTWGFFVTLSMPGIGSVIWWGLIPVGTPQGTFADKAVFVFCVHPLAASFLSYLLCSMFLIALDHQMPWRPMKTFLPTISAVYFTQVLFPGLQVLFDRPFEVMAVPALLLTFVVTIIGVHRTPTAWLACNCSATQQQLALATKVFTKISIVVFLYSCVLAAYTLASAQSTGVASGLLTVALSVLCFIFKKILLAFSDVISIDSAMLVSGFWIDNLTDMFITIAFPASEEFGVTFFIIFATRVVENAAYLGFQLDKWFQFRIWIKGKFKKDQGAAIEEDLEAYQDDRGHSAHHPGYRRRQLRFLSLKIYSQISSYFYFMIVCPVLRYGPNNLRFPYREVTEGGSLKAIYGDAFLDPSRGFLSTSTFYAAMLFAFIQIIAVLVGGAFIWWWMHRYCRDTILQVRERYNEIASNRVQYALVLGTMVSNALIATSFIQVYYRVFFL